MKSFSGSLYGNGYGIHGWTYDNGNNPAAFFIQADGALFKDVFLADISVTGNPAASLVITANNVLVENFRLSGQVKGVDGQERNIRGGDVNFRTSTELNFIVNFSELQDIHKLI